jgi:hypothetical protein
MTVSDYTDPVVRFGDEASAQVFAKFVASQGFPCHIVEASQRMHSTRYGVHVQRHRIDELKNILKLTPVACSVSPTAAQLMARQLSGAGIPCYAGDATSSLFDDASLAAADIEVGHVVAVPEPFSIGACGILGKDLPPGFGSVPVARVASEDPEHPY